jgi:hypothetical protein
LVPAFAIEHHGKTMQQRIGLKLAGAPASVVSNCTTQFLGKQNSPAAPSLSRWT